MHHQMYLKHLKTKKHFISRLNHCSIDLKTVFKTDYDSDKSKQFQDIFLNIKFYITLTVCGNSVVEVWSVIKCMEHKWMG